MHLFITPVFASALWVGGDPFSLLPIAAFMRPLLRGKRVNHSKDDFAKLWD